ncbi:MAG: tRNA (N6-threonylcarbamoyladenosine(37)-N6)-methyltransferase TrmO [Eubacteriales bacterium]
MGFEIPPMKVIARIHTDFSEKFGIPRQSGLADQLRGVVVFEPDYRNADSLRGIEEYSHLWLVWLFSQAIREQWSPTVRPPRLGGNTRVGVFASRSPFRPNPIGLSSVRLLKVERHPKWGSVLHVAGADLLDGTPILDIKPYLPYTDSHPEARGSYGQQHSQDALLVEIPPEWEAKVPPGKRVALRQVLACDPRPSYQQDEERVYGMEFAGMQVRFRVEGNCLIVCEVVNELTK